jgi:hypothetical protein
LGKAAGLHNKIPGDRCPVVPKKSCRGLCERIASNFVAGAIGRGRDKLLR